METTETYSSNNRYWWLMLIIGIFLFFAVYGYSEIRLNPILRWRFISVSCLSCMGSVKL